MAVLAISPFECIGLFFFVPGQVWDYLCPGKWDHLCPGAWDHLCPRAWDHLCPGAWDHLCPLAWDHLCPASMELRIDSKCQLKNSLCLFHMFVKFAIKGQFVPSTGLGTICAKHLWSSVLISLCLFNMFLNLRFRDHVSPFPGLGAICAHEC